MKSLLRHEKITQLYSVIKSLYKSNFVPAYTKDRPILAKRGFKSFCF